MYGKSRQRESSKEQSQTNTVSFTLLSVSSSVVCKNSRQIFYTNNLFTTMNYSTSSIPRSVCSVFLFVHPFFHLGHIQGCMTPVSDVLGDMSCI